MNWNITAGRPVYVQLVEQLELALVAGEFLPGSRIPPVRELAARIANAARNVLESTPPELAADVSGTGILLTGGGSLLRGLAGYITGELHTDVAIAPDPLNCVARGTAISLSEGKYLSAGFRDATPKVWNRRLNHSHDPFTGE